MSTVYFHTPPGGQAKLAGAERARMCQLWTIPAIGAWRVENAGTDLAHLTRIVGMLDDASGYGAAASLRRQLQLAQAEDANNAAAWRATKRARAAAQAAGVNPGVPYADTSYEEFGRLRRQLATVLARPHMADLVIVVGDRRLNVLDVNLNTALLCGSDRIRLAAKIDGYCESHCWVEGPDRAWLADLFESGLDQHLFRRQRTIIDRDDNGEPLPPRIVDHGWAQVLDLLHASDRDPVVLSYSVTNRFPGERSWGAALRDLRRNRPWARLRPDTLVESYFGPPVTVYDVLADDAVDRVDAAVTTEHETEAPA